MFQSFLKEYGLIWVGDSGGSDSTGSESGQRHSVVSIQTELFSVLKHANCWCHLRTDPSTSNFGVNFDLVLHRIRELNVLAGEGESFVQLTATGAQLVPKQPVRLSLYRDGIVMFDGPFRSYQEHSTQVSVMQRDATPPLHTAASNLCSSHLQQFVQDLMDGYFPSELQSRFPDGIPFEVLRPCEEKIVAKCAILQLHSFLSRFTTEETRSSPPGLQFLVRDRLEILQTSHQPLKPTLHFLSLSPSI